MLPEQLPPAPHHSEQATRQLQAGPGPKFPSCGGDELSEMQFLAFRNLPAGECAAAMEEREEHEGLARKQPTLGDGKSRAEKIIHNLVGKCIHAFQPFCSPFVGT